MLRYLPLHTSRYLSLGVEFGWSINDGLSLFHCATHVRKTRAHVSKNKLDLAGPLARQHLERGNAISPVEGDSLLVQEALFPQGMRGGKSLEGIPPVQRMQTGRQGLWRPVFPRLFSLAEASELRRPGLWANLSAFSE